MSIEKLRKSLSSKPADNHFHILWRDEQMSVQQSRDSKRRQVKERVINEAKLTGKCGLSYEGDCNKAAYDLENIAVNCGNFMELLLLLS